MRLARVGAELESLVLHLILLILMDGGLSGSLRGGWVLLG